MTELRKKILINAYQTEKKQKEKTIINDNQEIEILKKDIENVALEKNMAIKYYLYADKQIILRLKELKEEIRILMNDIKISHVTNSLFTGIALISIFKGLGIEGYCLTSILNMANGYTLDKKDNNFKNYKLVKKSFKTHLKKLSITDLEALINGLNYKYNYLISKLNNYTNKRNYLEAQLKLLEAISTNNIYYTNGKLKPIFENNASKEKYKSLNNCSLPFLPNYLECAKIKTLKNKVIVK